MSDNRGDHLHGRQESTDSIIVKTSSGPTWKALVHETPGDLFDAPNGTALIREGSSYG
jgi:hypothetical protein